MSTSYTPLYDPGTNPVFASLDVEIAVTRQILDETAGLNIHDRTDMEKAAFSLNVRLRTLLAAIEAEHGERR